MEITGKSIVMSRIAGIGDGEESARKRESVVGGEGRVHAHGPIPRARV